MSKSRDFTNNPDSTECKHSDIIYGVHIDLSKAFQRCTKKYFYAACSRVNKWSVSFKCYEGDNENEKKNVTTYSHQCGMLYFRSSQQSLDPNFGFSGNYQGLDKPELEGAIYPWMLGD